MISQGDIIQERYRITRPLGSGGFGAVYLAEDQRLARPVAIKEISEARLHDEERRIAVGLFEREALMLAQLDHPGLTRVWDYFREGSHAFLVMEYVPGPTLRDLLRRAGGALAERFVIECAIQLCAVLAYLHSRRPQVIFRDLKPANVIVVEQPGAEPLDLLNLPPEEQTFKLIDFGIARFFKPEQTGDTLIIGTPGYAPPEQYGQGQTDARSDLYSLGATMHHLLSGQAPNAIPLPPLATAAPHVSAELARVVARATQLDPHDRYPDAEALRRDLLAIASVRPAVTHTGALANDQRSPAHSPPVLVPRAPVRAPARPRPAASLPLLLVLAAIIGALALGAVAIGMFGTLGPQVRQPGDAPPASAQPSRAAQGAAWALPGASGRIAFGQLKDAGGYDLFVATPNGEQTRALIAGGNDTALAWAPDGKRLAITHAVDGSRAIFIGSVDNPAAERVSPAGVEARYPAWSPDGGRLAFTTMSENKIWRLAIIDLASRQVTYPGPERLGWVSWARGALLYAARVDQNGPQDIFALDESGVPHNLTDSLDAEEDFPDRSPDGSSILFVSSPPGQQNLPLRQIYAMKADGSGRTQLTQGDGPHTNPVWSPDGEWIAYLSQAGGGDYQVWAMRADGSEPRQLTSGSAQKFYLAWGK